MATKQFTLNFPDQDGQFSATLETFQQAAYRMDMPEEQLLVEALGFYLAAIRNEEGQIQNYRACNEQVAARGISHQSANLKKLFQKLDEDALS